MHPEGAIIDITRKTASTSPSGAGGAGGAGNLQMQSLESSGQAAEQVPCHTTLPSGAAAL